MIPNAQPADRRVSARPDDFLQEAINIVHDFPVDDAEATARAAVLVSMAKELRLGISKSRKYGDLDRPDPSSITISTPPTTIHVKIGPGTRISAEVDDSLAPGTVQPFSPDDPTEGEAHGALPAGTASPYEQ